MAKASRRDANPSVTVTTLAGENSRWMLGQQMVYFEWLSFCFCTTVRLSMMNEDTKKVDTPENIFNNIPPNPRSSPVGGHMHGVTGL